MSGSVAVRITELRRAFGSVVALDGARRDGERARRGAQYRDRGVDHRGRVGAVVVLGRWSPWSVLGSGLFFGAASALHFLLQTLGSNIGYQLFLALPYILVPAALGGWFGRARAPAALALPWPRTQ